MRTHIGWATGFILGLTGLASAQPAPECRFDRAIYSQPDSDWVLRFARLPRDSAANQSARFLLHLTSGTVLEGAVYWPNGYGAPIYLLEGPCSGAADAETCAFVQDGSATPYVLTDDGIARIPSDMDGPAPRQLLLPQLAISLWYSLHRNAEFVSEPGDVFTLTGCQQAVAAP